MMVPRPTIRIRRCRDGYGAVKIQWIRVLLAGFLIEVILGVVLIGGFAAAGVSLQENISALSATIIGVGCFAAAFLVVLWLGRGIRSRVVLHGLLIGAVATAIYLGLVAGTGQMPTALAAYGPVTFVIVNGARLVGAVLGGIQCERSRRAA
jgi:hypothetical protein